MRINLFTYLSQRTNQLWVKASRSLFPHCGVDVFVPEKMQEKAETEISEGSAAFFLKYNSQRSLGSAFVTFADTKEINETLFCKSIQPVCGGLYVMKS